ncbi:MAG: hypothetical protein AVDCRST_MAG51-3394, partial [uncultured Ramlibacter sp.]
CPSRTCTKLPRGSCGCRPAASCGWCCRPRDGSARGSRSRWSG